MFHDSEKHCELRRNPPRLLTLRDIVDRGPGLESQKKYTVELILMCRFQI